MANQEMVGYVYIIYNIKNGRFYLGSTKKSSARKGKHFTSLRGGYHTSIHLQRAFNLYGEDSFIFELQERFDSIEEAQYYEQETLNDLWGLGILYNSSRYASGGDNISKHPDRDLIVEKMRKSVNNRYSNMTKLERKLKHGMPGDTNPMHGKSHSEKTRQNISKKLLDYYKIHDSANKGRRATPETKEKLSLIASQRTGSKNPFYGKHHSNKTKQKIADSRRGKIPKNARKVLVDGIEYISVTEAARKLCVCPATIIFRIKHSTKYLGYTYM